MTLFASRLPLYTCPACGTVTRDPDHSFDDHYCPTCHSVLGAADCEVTDANYVTIAMYEVSRAYGGPEEGGWYYDAGTLMAGTQRSFLLEDAPQAEIYREVLERRAKEESATERRYGGSLRFAVRVWFEEDAPKSFPRQRPTYC